MVLISHLYLQPKKTKTINSDFFAATVHTMKKLSLLPENEKSAAMIKELKQQVFANMTGQTATQIEHEGNK